MHTIIIIIIVSLKYTELGYHFSAYLVFSLITLKYCKFNILTWFYSKHSYFSRFLVWLMVFDVSHFILIEHFFNSEIGFFTSLTHAFFSWVPKTIIAISLGLSKTNVYTHDTYIYYIHIIRACMRVSFICVIHSGFAAPSSRWSS